MKYTAGTGKEVNRVGKEGRKEGRKEGVSTPNVGHVNHSWNSINRYIEIHTFFRIRDLS